MKVRDLMSSDVQTINGDVGLQEAIVSLADTHVSAMPVLDGRGQMIGVLSASDVIAAEAEADPGVQLEDTRVRDVMTPRSLTVAPDADVRDAARQMLYADVHRLFVTVEDRLVGVISTSDIVRAVAADRF